MVMNDHKHCRLVTAAFPLIGEGFPSLRHKFPFVAGRMKNQFENAEGIAVSHLTPVLDDAELSMSCTTSPDDERADPPERIDSAVYIQWREPFIVVIMAGERKINARSVERLPDRAHHLVVLVPTGRKSRMMPIGQCAEGWMRR